MKSKIKIEPVSIGDRVWCLFVSVFICQLPIISVGMNFKLKWYVIVGLILIASISLAFLMITQMSTDRIIKYINEKAEEEETEYELHI